ncbi:amidohydrolase [Paenibacillus sp. HN-1]|uniref:amidohydrolase n=1 Tax=Paenibacillus TaxID=44249 RepID=UPI001CA808F7|nr:MULTISPECIES: amidohydrolase [Paenibacillus]MBY9080421.1 amidohydrolase [Paenibacillus sp. CGMCC 1.18879]MBY9084001.1 amidohydrolase [Paenibacillus sinensis]
MSGTLFINGRLYTAGPKDADSVYVENGKIAAIGRRDELMLQLAGKDYRKIDWDGGFVLPGLADSHLHLGMQGMKLGMLDFTGAASKEEMLAMVAERACTLPEGEWILGLNWNENQFDPPIAPTRLELDAVTDRHPVFLTRTCFHAFLGNSAAFRLAGVAESTPDPVSGAYGRGEDGRLNGWVYEDACGPFNAVTPAPDYTELKDAMRRACRHALSLGLTAGHTEDLRLLGSVDTMLRIHKELREEGLCFRTHQLLFHDYLPEAEGLGLRPGSGDDWLRIGAVKLFSDGAIGGRTALLAAPYHDAPHTSGMALHSRERLAELVAEARRLSYPVAVHAIGDGAAGLTLGAMESVPLPYDSRLPDRLIHAQVLNEALVKRMRGLRLIADIQPRFVASDFPWVLDRVGPDRTEYLYAWKKLIASGVVCAGGSDAPIEPLDPFLGMHAAVTRSRPGEKHEGYLPEEKLSVDTAIHLFTRGSAAAAGEERERGAIETGYFADFTVIDRDITRNQGELLSVRTKMTVVNGIIAYEEA